MGEGDPAPDPAVVDVVEVVDGDTIRVRYVSGHVGPVRYIGIDTPETGYGRPPRECFGREATRANRELVGGQRVRLVFDRERRDRYDRVLAYVTRDRDGLFVNAELVRQGFATPLTIPPNVARAAELRRLADAARAANRGLWKACAP